MGYIYLYRNVVLFTICSIYFVDTHAGGGITDHVGGLLVPEVGTISGASTKSKEIIRTETGHKDLSLLDPQAIQLSAGHQQNAILPRKQIEGSQVLNRKRNRFNQNRKKNKRLKTEKKKKRQKQRKLKRQKQRKQKRQKNKQKRQILKRIRKQKLELAKTATSEVNVNVSNKPSRWENRRLKILQRMRARKAKVDIKKKLDAIRKANKQRQKEITKSNNAISILKGVNTLKGALKNNVLTKEGTSMPADIPVKQGVDLKMKSENDLNLISDKNILPSVSITNIDHGLNSTGNIRQTNETNIVNSESATRGTNGSNQKSHIDNNESKIDARANHGFMLPVVPGFTLNDMPTIDLTGVIDPRRQMKALGIVPDFHDPSNSENIQTGIPLGTANIGDNSFQQFNHGTGLQVDNPVGVNVISEGNVGTNIGIPLGPIGSEMNIPFELNSIDTNKQTGRLRIPLEKINGGDEQFDVGIGNNGANLEPGPKEPSTNLAFDLNGNGIPISPVKTLTDLIQEQQNPNQNDLTTEMPVDKTSTVTPNQSLNTILEINKMPNTTTNTDHSNSPSKTSLNSSNKVNQTLNNINQFNTGDNETQFQTKHNVTQAGDHMLNQNLAGVPLGTVDLNQQNNSPETGFNPLFSTSGEAAVFQSVDLNEFFSTGNINDVDNSHQPPIPTQDKENSESGIRTISGELMPIAGQPISDSPSNLPNTASSKSKLPSSSLLGVLFDIKRSLRQGKGK